MEAVSVLTAFALVALTTTLFVLGSVCVVRCLGEGSNGNSLSAALFGVIGLALKFPAVIVTLNIAKTGADAERGGAMAAVTLVYFLSVVGASIYGLQQNRKDQ
ncbi:MAG: hypothetical protein CBB60_006535 [Armatimonadetes bacterium Cent15-Ar3]|nr:MAG: hypothetical protein CBB60_006535 [Armatimonadetes bacterium Cent15-Ar3]